MKQIAIIIATLAMAATAAHADDMPTINPTATYDIDGVEVVSSDTTASAPLKGIFRANPENVGDYTAYYEWRFYDPSAPDEPWLLRYEEDTEYEFTTTGTTYIECYAIFTHNEDTVEYTSEYWSENEPLKVTIPESNLKMPNAFSPNGDGINDIYKAKEGWSSLVEFKATIFNRWGKKLYQWTDPNDGWDGTYNGKPVKQGVYFVDVRATGSDGVKYHFRRDVNLLRGYTESTSTSSTTEQ